MNKAEGRYFSLPSVVFFLAFVLLGWIAGHSIAYALVGLLPHGHDHHEQHIHSYLEALKLAGGCGLVFAFAIALRMFFNHETFGEWLHEGGIAGTRKQIALSTSPRPRLHRHRVPGAIRCRDGHHSVRPFARGRRLHPAGRGTVVFGPRAHGVPGRREGHRVRRTGEASSTG
jgi:hypothetical protein